MHSPDAREQAMFLRNVKRSQVFEKVSISIHKSLKKNISQGKQTDLSPIDYYVTSLYGSGLSKWSP